MKLFIQLFFFLTVTATTLPAQLDMFYPDDLVVTATSLNLREKPSKDAPIVMTLNRGDIVQFLEADNHNEQVEVNSVWGAWLRVRVQSKSGYLFSPHVTGTFTLQYEGDMMDNLPPVNWYGVYRRDSFADELRPVKVRLEEEMNEFVGTKVKVLKTNQKDVSKFLVGTATPLKTGYVGPLGIFKVSDFFASDDLGPGSMMGLQPGSDVSDTTTKEAYTLAATGCAQLSENMIVTMNDYRLLLIDFSKATPQTQDLTPWVKSLVPEIPISASLLWYGDLDMDNKPDVIINDCPYEVGCRSSLLLSSKRRKGEYLRKVTEHFFGGD